MALVCRAARSRTEAPGTMSASDQREKMMIVILVTLVIELCLVFIAWVRP